MENANVESEFRQNELKFCLSGEIDHHSAAAVREQMDRDLYFYRPQKVVLSMRDVEFMDSSGLGLILGRYTKIKDLGGTMKIEDPGEETEKLLRLAGVERLIPVVKTSAKEKKRTVAAKGAPPAGAVGSSAGKQEKNR